MIISSHSPPALPLAGMGYCLRVLTVEDNHQMIGISPFNHVRNTVYCLLRGSLAKLKGLKIIRNSRSHWGRGGARMGRWRCRDAKIITCSEATPAARWAKSTETLSNDSMSSDLTFEPSPTIAFRLSTEKKWLMLNFASWSAKNARNTLRMVKDMFGNLQRKYLWSSWVQT